MYNYTATLEIALTATDRIVIAAEKIETAVYKADKYYQETVIPFALHAGIMAIHYFIQAVIFTYCASVWTGRWYRTWAADYYAPIEVETVLIVEEQPLLPAAPQPQLLLPAAIDKPVRLPSRWVGDTVIVTPAPKTTRAPRARKAPTAAPKGKGKKQPVSV